LKEAKTNLKSLGGHDKAH